jgi:hypothetical protein
MHLFGFSKHLTTIIGTMDTGYKDFNYEDTDWMSKLFINDLALYFSLETPIERKLSTWYGKSKNKEYYDSKWIHEFGHLIQVHDDMNAHHRELYKGVYPEIDYLPWDCSNLVPHISGWFSGMTRDKQC